MAAPHRHLRIILVACVTLGVFASTALATEATITSTSGDYPMIVEGSAIGKKPVFTVGGGSAECETAALSGSISGPTGSFTLTPNFGGSGACKGFGISGGTWTINGCVFDVATASSGATTASLTLVCPSGQELRFDTALNFCTVHVKPQGPLAHVLFANSGLHVESTWALTGVHAVVTGAFCTVPPGIYNNATFAFTETLVGKGFGVNGIDVS